MKYDRAAKYFWKFSPSFKFFFFGFLKLYVLGAILS